MKHAMLYVLVAVMMTGCTAARTQPVDTEAEERALRALEERWSAAAQARDADAFASFFAEDGVQFQPNMQPLVGRAAIASAARAFFPQATLSWVPETVEVAQSGELGYVQGVYTLSMRTPGGPVSDTGTYLVVWKKIDGEWKAIADIFNSRLPMPSSSGGAPASTAPDAQG